MTARGALAFAAALAACAAPHDSLPGPCTFVSDRQDVLAVPAGHIHVLLFVTPDCPIANAYAPEIGSIARQLRGSEVRLFLVHVDPDTTVASARAHAAAYGLDLPILLDPAQDLARSLGATVTPEAAVLTPAGLQYLGRIDDRWRARGSDGQEPEHRDLRDAIAALRSGRPVATPRTPAVGCLLPEPRR